MGNNCYIWFGSAVKNDVVIGIGSMGLKYIPDNAIRVDNQQRELR